MKRARTSPFSGFTLVELLVVLAITALLVAISLPALSSAMTSGRAAASMTNLRQLAAANITYASDHNGYYCPAQDASNSIRWHGGRGIGSSQSTAFDPGKGYLSPYLGADGRVKVCPLFASMVTGTASFENGTGGYGYNEMYIGGTPADWLQPANTTNVHRPALTIMFTTTAFAVSGGLQEYAFSEPYTWPDPSWGSVFPSVHFRDHGHALVAWCDGHVTAEVPDKIGDDYAPNKSPLGYIGWFGPSENNGYWNPAYTGP